MTKLKLLTASKPERFGLRANEFLLRHNRRASFRPRGKPALHRCAPFATGAYITGTARFRRLSSTEVFPQGAFHETATFAYCHSPTSSTASPTTFHQHGYPSKKLQTQYPAGRSKRRCRRSTPSRHSPVRVHHA